MWKPWKTAFGNVSKCIDAGAMYATEGDKVVTLRLDSIVSIHTEAIEYSHHRYCIVTMANGFRYKITETTADEIRLHLDVDNVFTRGEE